MDQNYLDTLRTWRQDYVQKLLAPDSWFAISGLFWLAPGLNRMGSDPDCQIVLPAGAAPALAGTFLTKEGEITLEAAPGVSLRINDQPVTKAQIKINSYGSSDWISLNELKMSVIQRGVRLGVRVYDKNHPALLQFVSLRWYPIQPEYCIPARFVPLDPPIKLPIVNVLGDASEEDSPGYAEFTFEGQVCRLYALPIEDSDRLWFIFQDLTGKTVTYAGGRYMTSEAPQAGEVVLDFNKAHNPPCAYTDFATCPLPPSDNRLNVSIKAGELKYSRPTSLGG